MQSISRHVSHQDGDDLDLTKADYGISGFPGQPVKSITHY